MYGERFNMYAKRARLKEDFIEVKKLEHILQRYIDISVERNVIF